MNYWQNEVMGNAHREQLIEEAEQDRLQRVALKSRVYHPGFFERSMFRFANWMISTGKQLRRRYEVPVSNCTQSPTSSLAR